MIIRPVMEYELPQILREAAAFDLDVQSPNYRQFSVVEHNQAIVGFGRIIRHAGFSELATVGVIKKEQGKGYGSALVKAMAVRVESEPLYLVTVLPDYFKRLGFEVSTETIAVLQPKIRFCEIFGFRREEIATMRFKEA